MDDQFEVVCCLCDGNKVIRLNIPPYPKSSTETLLAKYYCPDCGKITDGTKIEK